MENYVYPTLTEVEKTQIVALCNDYYAKRDLFKYGGRYRNQYASRDCMTKNKDQFLMNCGCFAQMIWMGRSAADFDIENYSPKINKAFDWGYYFNFAIHKACANVKKNPDAQILQEQYYGYQNPTKDNPYTFNCFAKGSGIEDRSFMAAADLAQELYTMGCEIPRRELQVGDLVFHRAPEYTGMPLETQLNFRCISHVAVVIDTNYKDTGYMRVMEVTFWDPTGTISTISLAEDDMNNRMRGGFYENRLVMCARHPHAFGRGGNVPDVITEI